MPLQKMLPSIFRQLLQKKALEEVSKIRERVATNNYFLHLKCEGMLHEGNYNLHLDSY